MIHTPDGLKYFGKYRGIVCDLDDKKKKQIQGCA